MKQHDDTDRLNDQPADSDRAHAHADDQRHDHDHDHPHPHDHDHDHPHADAHPHDTDYPHPHDHDPDHSHPHDHDHGRGLWGWLSAVFHLHGHSHQREALAADPAFAATSVGIRTVWLALASLGITAVLQVAIVFWSGSVALLADTIHNIGDGLNSVPLLIAFYLARRAATRRYTYGFARAEDVAGVIIVLSIAFSAAVVFWESFQKLLNPQPMSNLGWVAAAAVIGFIGNEAVAILQIRTGRKIGSAALVADGLHARTDGFTSLAVLLAVGGSWLGFPIIDPIVGLAIGVAILFITRDATVTMWYRLMDAIDPSEVDRVEQVAANVPGAEQVHDVRVRWLGHRLYAELHIVVDEDLPTRESHRIVEAVRHALFHAQPRLANVLVHVDPCGHSGENPHQITAHHDSPSSTGQPNLAPS